jgi:hypothetical protein
MLVIIGAVGLLILVALIFGGGELPDAIAFILALAAIIFIGGVGIAVLGKAFPLTIFMGGIVFLMIRGMAK